MRPSLSIIMVILAYVASMGFSILYVVCLGGATLWKKNASVDRYKYFHFTVKRSPLFISLIIVCCLTVYPFFRIALQVSRESRGDSDLMFGLMLVLLSNVVFFIFMLWDFLWYQVPDKLFFCSLVILWCLPGFLLCTVSMYLS